MIYLTSIILNCNNSAYSITKKSVGAIKKILKKKKKLMKRKTSFVF